MNCPYCTSPTPEAALVCATCHRDLYLVRQLSSRVAELEAELARQAALRPATAPETEGPVAEASAIASNPLPEPQLAEPSWSIGLFAWLAPLVLLLLAHWLVIFVYDAKVLYLRLLALLLPLPFGFLFARAVQWRFGWSVVPAFLMAATAVIGMSAITAWLDQVPVLPQNMVDVREFIEFAASIGFSFVTGLWIYESLRRRSERRVAIQAELRRRLGPLAANSQQIGDSLTRLDEMGSAIIGVATSAVSIYTGLKGFFGS